MHERGEGFLDEEWALYDASQKRMADAAEKAAIDLERASKALAAGALTQDDKRTIHRFKLATGADNGTPSVMDDAARTLRESVVALRAGPGSGYVARGIHGAQAWAAEKASPGAAQASRRGSRGVAVNLDHPHFDDEYMRDWHTFHEAPHGDSALDDEVVIGTDGKNHRAYKFNDNGFYFDRLRATDPARAARNPDHLTEFVFNYRPKGF